MTAISGQYRPEGLSPYPVRSDPKSRQSVITELLDIQLVLSELVTNLLAR